VYFLLFLLLLEDPEKYLVNDSKSEREHKFKLRTSLQSAQEKSLLEGVSFYVTKSVRPPPADLKTVIVAGAGVYLSRVPTSRTPGNVVVISCDEDETQHRKLAKAGFPPHNAELLLCGVLQQRFDPTRYELGTSSAASSSSSSAPPTRKRTRR
jgi:BRCT domain, a BRCA1 C-terminus domain